MKTTGSTCPYADRQKGESGCVWHVTQDHLASQFPEDFPSNGLDGSHVRSFGWDETNPEKADRISFRMYDDDGELYFTGECTDQCFCPLDWGRADSGATEIKYQQPDGEWETL